MTTTIQFHNPDGIAAPFSRSDLVKVDGFVTHPDLVPLYRTVRERRLAGHAPASTLVIVSGLVTPNLQVEIRAIAAR
ncbi:RidA family protein [Burkholderia ubonensis]|uniref:RidA family protein n=1 Tax=Burkholderia ubonensis TaxID=101571 RepID=UPI00358E4ED7